MVVKISGRAIARLHHVVTCLLCISWAKLNTIFFPILLPSQILFVYSVCDKYEDS